MMYDVVDSGDTREGGCVADSTHAFAPMTRVVDPAGHIVGEVAPGAATNEPTGARVQGM